MAKKLYYENPYQHSFETNLARQGQDEEGTWYAVLEETAFYPEGGGQPFDTGTLNGVQVTKVEEKNGEIRHYLQRQLELEAGATLAGKIDWERRFDHMQQHSGQHILSAAFDNLFGFKTVSFHLGREESTIDLGIDWLDDSHIEAAENLSNQIVLENRPIETKWVSKEEADKLPLRKALSVEDGIRLVIIPEFDYNGCGGTHPFSTSEAGMIKILGAEKEKKKVRITFVAGKRSFHQFSKKQQAITRLTPLLNVPQEDMEAAVLKLLQTKSSLEKRLDEAEEQIIGYEANHILQNRNEKDIPIARLFKNRPIQDLQKLARAIVKDEDSVTVVLVSENDDKLQLVCAKSEGGRGNMKEVLGIALKIINGKGGGNELFAQGGGDALCSGQELLEKTVSSM
ncbi:DHHA1 domain-containing protein [Bacillus sp. FJAT-27445]|uniref:alanyl-tRNA editing protein n=1 Tax=Bacillus sp. FJAT-27445 TaxID=1679166 RepID=UPI0007437BFA|nr:DHHA1 domain-containing protein [Bacillus sp. FJAT-27445]